MTTLSLLVGREFLLPQRVVPVEIPLFVTSNPFTVVPLTIIVFVSEDQSDPTSMAALLLTSV